MKGRHGALFTRGLSKWAFAHLRSFLMTSRCCRTVTALVINMWTKTGPEGTSAEAQGPQSTVPWECSVRSPHRPSATPYPGCGYPKA